MTSPYVEQAAERAEKIGNLPRFVCRSWGDGSSAEGFVNILDTQEELIVATDVASDYAEIMCEALNDKSSELQHPYKAALEE